MAADVSLDGQAERLATGVKRLWIAWEDDSSIRSRVLADELGADYRAFTRFTGSRLFGWLRYPAATLATLWILLGHRPDLLVVQNPSILLAFQAAVLRTVFGYRLVIDLHTQFLEATGLSRLVADALHGYGLRHCDAVIVTNESYRQRIERQTDRPVFVLPDKVPEVGQDATSYAVEGEFNVLYICTFSNDEPWEEVVAAAELMPTDTRIYISGRNPLDPDQVTEHVVLTGFLPRDEYQNLLRSVDAVMVLTTAEENLVCGGYEAVGAEKPLILSDTAALRGLFRKGTVFTQNDRRAIASAISDLRMARRELERDVAALKTEMATSWREQWRTMLGELDLLESAGRGR